MIEKELRETSAMRAERKRTSLIAALVSSLQEDENLEATKTEEDKKRLAIGRIDGLDQSFFNSALYFFIFRSFSC
jgi:hypothetical protein